MREPLDELYFKWLYSQVGSVDDRNPSKTYWKVLKELYTKEFVWIIPNDDNRAADGKDLRYEFINDQRINPVDSDWLRLDCSMLELLIGLSRRLSFETEREPYIWFWHLMENLGLESCNDNSMFSKKQVNQILDEVIWRLYRRNGRGGLFPLKRPHGDQREVEIWYQLQEYILENGY